MTATRRTASNSETPRVLVVGDVRLDWLIVKGVSRSSRAEERDSRASSVPTARFAKQKGGALLLADVYRRLAGDVGPDPVLTYGAWWPGSNPSGDKRLLNASNGCWLQRLLNSVDPLDFPHAVLELDRDGAKEAGGGESPGVFRVKRQFEVRDVSDVVVAQPQLELDARGAAPVHLALVDDMKLGFWNQAPHPEILQVLRDCATVVLATQWPVQGEFWKQVRAGCGKGGRRLIVVLNASYLRAQGKKISRGLSWQKTVRELLKTLTEEFVNGEVIVRLGQEAALHWDGKGKDWWLYYYPDRAEDYCKEAHPGDMVGAHAVFTASVGFALRRGDQTIGEGIREGITYACRWHEAGFGTIPEEVAYPLSLIDGWKEKGADRSIQSALFDQEKASKSLFLFYDDAGNEADVRGVAEAIVRVGSKEIAKFPRAVFSGVSWVDPREAETYRHVAALVGEYLKRETTRPLSIAVFGPPGSGKSFGVSTVAKTLDKLSQPPLEFNLSQWESADRLVTAFHNVREVSVTGRIPLVFFDEFDSKLVGQPLGWLKYFLAPMNDGKFRAGDSEYSLGKSVFVFAGGTSETFQQFQKECRADDGKAAKAPDFLSRLQGHVDVLGPSPRPNDPDDTLHVVRRALILRGMLEKKAKSLFTDTVLEIHPEVLQKLLTANYRHGARSIEAVLDMSRIVGKTTFGLADLPPDEQLDVHIDAT